MADALTHRGYTGHAEYHPEDRVFHGRILEIDDVVTFEGRSVDELEQAFRDSVEEYLAYCEETGRRPDKPFSGRLNLRMSPELHRRLHIRAEREGRSINSIIIESLDRAV